jgi:subtilisin family serine protease
MKRNKKSTGSIVMLLFSFCIFQLGAQTFKLKQKEYRFIEKNWYGIVNGERGDKIIPERLIVKAKESVDLRKINLEDNGLENVHLIPERLDGNYYVLEVKKPFDPFQVAKMIENNPLLENVEFSSLCVMYSVPNDTYYTNPADYQWNLKKILMPNAWDMATGSSSILVAIIDTGVDYNHEDLSGNIWRNPKEATGDANGDGRPGIINLDDDGDGKIDEDSNDRQPGETGYTNDLKDDDDENGFIDDFNGWDFYENDNNPFPASSGLAAAHGTCVTGILAAQTNNNMGIAGIAGGWGNTMGVKLMILRGSDPSGQMSDDVAARCIKYARLNGAKIINMSWGDQEEHQVIKDAIYLAYVNQVTLVAAAGNENLNSLSYPARWSDMVIAVGATLRDDTRWKNDGGQGSNAGPELDIMAPGGAKNIYTTDITGSGGYSTGNYNPNFGGTSASTPHVSGVVALMLSLKPNLYNTTIQQYLRDTADKVPGMNGQNFTNEYGYGRVNAYKAVKKVYLEYLNDLAATNKTPNISPTIYNNQRILARGKNNTNILYEVFSSGTLNNYEILFRKSTDNGLNWLSPLRLSEGNIGVQEENKQPCITVTDDGTEDYVHVIWQKKKINGKYDICYCRSINSGSSWSTMQTLAGATDVTVSSYQSAGPMPVITWASLQSGYRLLAVYATSSGLAWRFRNSGGSWTNPGEGVPIPAGCSGEKVWYPSIMGEQNWASLVCDYHDIHSGVYSYIYNPTSNTWSNGFSISSVSHYYDRAAQVTIIPGNKVIAVWMAQPNGDGIYKIIHREGYSDNSWPGQCTVFDRANAQYPTISPFLYYNWNRAVVFGTTDNQIIMYKATSNPPVGWNSFIESINANYPNITNESGSFTPKMIWTMVNSSPYNMTLSSQYLPKESEPVPMIYHRRIVLTDKKNHSSLCVEFGEIEAKDSEGNSIRLPIKKIDPNMTADRSNFMDCLSSDPVTLPGNIKELRFYQNVYTVAHHDSNEAKQPTSFKSFSVSVSIEDFESGKKVNTITPFNENSGWINSSERKAIDIEMMAEKTVRFKTSISISGSSLENTDFMIEHVFIESSGVSENKIQKSSIAIPKNMVLLQNYPNPFNPLTEIRYAIPVDSKVWLTVYDLLGREVTRLIDEEKEAGYHSVKWDGRDQRGETVSSGVYLYQLKAGGKIEQRKMLFIR